MQKDINRVITAVIIAAAGMMVSCSNTLPTGGDVLKDCICDISSGLRKNGDCSLHENSPVSFLSKAVIRPLRSLPTASISIIQPDNQHAGKAIALITTIAIVQPIVIWKLRNRG